MKVEPKECPKCHCLPNIGGKFQSKVIGCQKCGMSVIGRRGDDISEVIKFWNIAVESIKKAMEDEQKEAQDEG